MGIPKLWVKGIGGAQGFVFSHVKTIYYNWASKILLSTKLDEMDALIDAKIAKAMMSGQQVNDANKVPTSALAYAMAQGIAANANNIAQLNNNFENSLRYRYKFSGDFNNLDIKPGIYFLETSQTWTNGPSPSPAYCMFIQFPAYRFQMIIDAHKIYTRKHTGSPPSWSLWRLHDSGESLSDTLLYQSGEVVCEPGLTEITIEHSDVSAYSQAMRFFSVIRPNDTATEQITVTMTYGNTATSTKFTVRNSGNSSRAVKINLCIFCK